MATEGFALFLGYNSRIIPVPYFFTISLFSTGFDRLQLKVPESWPCSSVRTLGSCQGGQMQTAIPLETQSPGQPG